MTKKTWVVRSLCLILLHSIFSIPASANSFFIYDEGNSVPQEELIPLGPPSGIGGEVLEGDPQVSARFDYLSADGKISAGVFQSTPGKVRVTFPFSEHATVLSGRVTVTDQHGNTTSMRTGDSYFIRQGTVVIFETKRNFQKSFLNFRE